MKEQERREERVENEEVIELGSVSEETQGGAASSTEGLSPKPT